MKHVVVGRDAAGKPIFNPECLHFAKTIEEYDFPFHPQLDKKAVMALFDLTFLTNHENVIFLGRPESVKRTWRSPWPSRLAVTDSRSISRPCRR